MRPRVPALALGLALLASVLPPAHAGGADDACGCRGHLCLGIITVGSGRADDPLPTFYVDDRNVLLGNGLWIYQESNGQDGLQRGGGTPIFPDAPPLCIDDSPHGPDTLVL